MAVHPKFWIVVPSFNASRYTRICIERLRSQTYGNFKAVIINDASTDDNQAVIDAGIAGDPRFRCHTRATNVGALRNIAETLDVLAARHGGPGGVDWERADDEDVVCLVDGDDCLLHDRVLETIAGVYAGTGCAATYSNMQDGHGTLTVSRPIDWETKRTNSYRSTPWGVGPVRSFKYRLWRHVPQDTHLKMRGKFFSDTYDQALMYCILELCGGNVVHIDESLYLLGYVGRSDGNTQLFFSDHIRRLKPLGRVE